MKWPFQRRTTLINGALGVLLVAGAGTAYLTLGDGGDGAAAATRVTRVERGTVSASVSASGSVESARSRDLSFATSGTVAKIYVKAGQKVVAGAVLARLDQTEALENIDEAKANLEAAEGGDTTSAKGYAGYLQVKNAYNSALRAYQGTVLKAPFAGTVTAVNGTVGGSSGGSGSSSSGSGSSGSASSGAGTSGGGGSGSSSSSSSGASSSSGSGFIELVDTKHLQIEGDFTEADTTKLKVGQTASITFDALTGTTATGKITSIGLSPTTTDNVVKFPATISLTKVPSGVRLGQTATVEITTASAEDVLYVPTAAVRTAGGQSTVTVVRNGRQSTVTVETGVKGDQGTEITSGLNEGDQVVVTSTGTGTSGTTQRGGFPGGGAGPAGGLGGGAPGGGGGRR